jgi:hypothetical protein
MPVTEIEGLFFSRPGRTVTPHSMREALGPAAFLMVVGAMAEMGHQLVDSGCETDVLARAIRRARHVGPLPPAAAPQEVWLHETHVYGEGTFPVGVLWFTDGDAARAWMEGERLRRIAARRAEWAGYDLDEEAYDSLTSAGAVGVEAPGRLAFDVGGETVVLRRETVQQPGAPQRPPQEFTHARDPETLENSCS